MESAIRTGGSNGYRSKRLSLHVVRPRRPAVEARKRPPMKNWEFAGFSVDNPLGCNYLHVVPIIALSKFRF
jgi:hypothetical protein